MKRKSEWKELLLDQLVKWESNYKNEDAETSEKLKAALIKRGQIVNLIVRPKGKKFEVINGNHRLDAMLEMNFKKAMCVNVGNVSDEDAAMIALETNEMRFETDEARLNKLLQSVNAKVNIDEMIRTIPWDKVEIENRIQSIGFDFSQFDKKNGSATGEQKSDERFRTFTISLPESVFNQLNDQLVRYKKAMYHGKDPELVANVAPMEAIIQAVAQIPDNQLI